MPKLTIEQSHSLDPAVVRQRLDALRARLAEKYGIDAAWKSDTEATFKRTGASGSIHCHAGKVVITVDLSFALSPLKGKVETRIREELASVLRESA
jgi:putative polyhydroxyalkanoate system protein